MLKSLKDLLITLAALAAVAAVVWGVDGCLRVDNVHRTTGKPYRWEMDQRLGALPPDHPDHEKRKAELDAADELRARERERRAAAANGDVRPEVGEQDAAERLAPGERPAEADPRE